MTFTLHADTGPDCNDVRGLTAQPLLEWWGVSLHQVGVDGNQPSAGKCQPAQGFALQGISDDVRGGVFGKLPLQDGSIHPGRAQLPPWRSTLEPQAL